jgi:hypothetical protein
MPLYRLFSSNSPLQSATSTTMVECADDDEAVQRAVVLCRQQTIEVWKGSHLVARVRNIVFGSDPNMTRRSETTEHECK